MFPWVLLYGFTGWFFNHPGILTGDQLTHYHAQEVLDGSLSELPSAESTAVAVINALNERAIEQGGPNVELLNTRPPAFRDVLQFLVSGDGATHKLRINPNSGDGQIRTSFAIKPPPSPSVKNPLLGVANARVKPNALTETMKNVPELLDELGFKKGKEVKRQGQARIVFEVAADGVPCVVTYNLANGSIASVVDNARPTIPAMRLMERMHLTRGYTAGRSTRWFWAVVVDAMFVSMIFWGVSGLLMWWQVKRTRRLGFIVLIVSAAVTVGLTLAMHETLTVRDHPRNKPAAVKVQQPKPLDETLNKPLDKPLDETLSR